MAVFLANASDFNIGTLNINDVGAPSPREYLRSKIAPGAIHDSAERSDASTCLEGTRVVVRDEIFTWGTRRDGQPENVLWLTGPAGAGKTAIVGSIAETLQKLRLLAASYFFSSFEGTQSRRYKRYFVATLAYQIARLPGFEFFASKLYGIINENLAIFDMNIRSQLSELILSPLREMQRAGYPFPSDAVVLVDGVDEVVAEGSNRLTGEQARLRNMSDQDEIIMALLHAASTPHFPFRILISSRPEGNIRRSLDSKPEVYRELFLDETYAPDSDIELYFRFQFSNIRVHYLPELPSWPAEEDIQRLVHAASGQFIYAVTVIRFIQNRGNTPQVQLDAILEVQSRAKGTNPLEPLHLLYEHILVTSPDPLRAAAWLRNMWTTTLSEKPAFFIRQLLEHQPGLAYHLLGSLTSLIHIDRKSVV